MLNVKITTLCEILNIHIMSLCSFLFSGPQLETPRRIPMIKDKFIFPPIFLFQMITKQVFSFRTKKIMFSKKYYVY